MYVADKLVSMLIRLFAINKCTLVKMGKKDEGMVKFSEKVYMIYIKKTKIKNVILLLKIMNKNRGIQNNFFNCWKGVFEFDLTSRNIGNLQKERKKFFLNKTA